MLTRLDYTVIHDNKKTLCFIGRSYHNTIFVRYFSATRAVVQHSYEELLNKDQDWFDSHQFIVTAADVGFKQTVVTGLAKFNPSYFSVIAKNNTKNVIINESIHFI